MRHLILLIFLFAFFGANGQVVFKKDTLQKQQLIYANDKGVFAQTFYKTKTNDTIWMPDAQFVSIGEILEKEAFFQAAEMQMDEYMVAKKEAAKKNKEVYKTMKDKYNTANPKP